MKTMIRNLVIRAMLVVLVVGLLAGCGTDSDKQETNRAQAVVEQTAQVVDGSQAVQNWAANPNGFASVKCEQENDYSRACFDRVTEEGLDEAESHFREVVALNKQIAQVEAELGESALVVAFEQFESKTGRDLAAEIQELEIVGG